MTEVFHPSPCSFQPLTNLPQTLASKNCQKYQVFETEPVQNYSRQKPSFFYLMHTQQLWSVHAMFFELNYAIQDL